MQIVIDGRIYQQLSGRLGNQLFQWAYSHQLNANYQTVVVPFHDKSHAIPGYEGNIDAFVSPCSHVSKSIRLDSVGLILKILDKLNIQFKNISKLMQSLLGISRTTHHFEIGQLVGKKPRIVTGFFTNWEVVRGVEDVLFAELQDAFERVEMPADIPKDYQVLHVRRGDFLDLKHSYGLLHPDFYMANLDPVLEAIICTDDADLARDIQENLRIRKVLGPEELSPTQALKLMAEAKILLMSNSTLSWWSGFYCSRNGGKAVIPKPYYKSAEAEYLYHPSFILAPSKFY